jgi:hypothetical protein
MLTQTKLVKPSYYIDRRRNTEADSTIRLYGNRMQRRKETGKSEMNMLSRLISYAVKVKMTYPDKILLHTFTVHSKLTAMGRDTL